MAHTSRQRRYVPALTCEQFEERLCLSSVSFDSHDIRILENDHGYSSVYAADVDQDGDLDVLTAHIELGEIAWHENIDGKGQFGEHQPITRLGEGPFRSQGQARSAKSVHAADVDGDGDMDVLSASSPGGIDGKVAWYENIDGKGSFGPQQLITTEAAGAEWVYATDVDGDGDVDVLATFTSVLNSKIAWYENRDGNGTFGPEKVVTNDVPGKRSVQVSDIDGDGDVDVLSASSSWNGDKLDNSKITWYRNIDGKGSFSEQQLITSAVEGWVSTAYATDVDGDGDLDVLTASDSEDGGKLSWRENIDSKGSFGGELLIAGIPYVRNWDSLVHATDMDGDGDMDALLASAWWGQDH